MHLRFVEIQNFRKLKSIRIDFADKTTLFVGANNSGKTSAMVALGHFLVDDGRFTTNDFTLSNWGRIDKIGADWEANSIQPGSQSPSLTDWESVLPSMDIWLQVTNNEIHHVSHLLPTLDWEGGLLGVRLRLEPKNIDELYKDYLSSISAAKEITMKAAEQKAKNVEYTLKLWPKSMHDFLIRRMRGLFTVRAYALDPSSHKLPVNGVAYPQPLPPGSEPIEGDPFKGLIRIDEINAQRGFGDANSKGASVDSDVRENHERSEKRKLSEQLRFYYAKHLDPSEFPEPSDLDALQAIENAQSVFDERLKVGFSDALNELEVLGYPGVTDPKLTISTKIRPTDGMNHDAAVQYEVIVNGQLN